MGLNVSKCICRAANYETFTEQTTCLFYRHIILTKMHAVGSQFLYQFHMVINNKSGSMLLTHTHSFQCHQTNIIYGSTFHT